MNVERPLLRSLVDLYDVLVDVLPAFTRTIMFFLTAREFSKSRVPIFLPCECQPREQLDKVR